MVFNELVLEVDENNCEDFLDNQFAVLNFFSDWHMNCLMVLPVMEELAEEFQGKIHFGKVNIEEAEDVAERFEISNVPSMIVFKNHQPIFRMENIVSEEVIRDKICCLL